jgi:predicted RNA-binding Zn-ribbon protein involved in translation (DUF1610 family)
MDIWDFVTLAVGAAVVLVLILALLDPKCPSCGNRDLIRTGVRDTEGEEVRCSFCGHTQRRNHYEKPRKFP